MFTASNGIRITVDERSTAHHPLTVSSLGLLAPSVAALREFFRSEEDTRLARWRWHENPDYVVRIREHGRVMVFSESQPWSSVTYSRHSASGLPVSDYQRAAAAYFDAHPIRKPILLQVQEDGTDEWFTIRTYPGDPDDRTHAYASAHLLVSQDVPARVIDKETA